MIGVLLALSLATSQSPVSDAQVLWSCEFDHAGDTQGFEIGTGIVSMDATADGLVMETEGSDPIVFGPEFRIPTGPGQALEIVYSCASESVGEIFYAHDRSGEYGGFSGAKRIDMHYLETAEPTTTVVWPFWIESPELIQIRVDPPSDTTFTLHSIRILEAPAGGPDAWSGELSDVGELLTPLAGAGIVGGRIVATGGPVLLIGPSIGPTTDKRPWIRTDWTQTTEDKPFQAAVVRPGKGGVQWRSLEPSPGGSANVWLAEAALLEDSSGFLLIQSLADWTAGTPLPIERVSLGTEPGGEPSPTVVFLGSTTPMPRAGASEELLFRLANVASAPLRSVSVYLELPEGLELTEGPARQNASRALVHGDAHDFRWPVRATEPGTYDVRVRALGTGIEIDQHATVEFTATTADVEAGGPPTPIPLETDYDVGVYYFPGWNTRASWEVLDMFPERTPVLGYYREGMPEIVDWQILWAAERGVTFFAYDWYWDKGGRHLEHGIQAYLESEYREYLDFCLLWANHNGAGSHSHEDMLAVTQFWIDNYFKEPGYYTVDGRPVVIFFNVHGPWADMGGPEEVAEAFEAMRALCIEQGVPPIYLIACVPPQPSLLARVEESGYDAVSAYNWPSLNSGGLKRAPFADLMEGYAKQWRAIDDRSDLPIMTPICGGWDSRPWHGEAALARTERTPELFEQHLRDAKEFMDTQTDALSKACIIEAWNEWGEGSYIGPHRQYGFQYLDAIARVFGRNESPARIVLPKDVGVGPYEIAPTGYRTEWTMDDPDQGWTPRGGADKIDWQDGKLSYTTSGWDPIIQGPPVRFAAEEYPSLSITMSLDIDAVVQLFWSTSTESASEANSYSFNVTGDGELREYVLPLSEKGTWAGTIRGLRLDPVPGGDARVVIDSIRFVAR